MLAAHAELDQLARRTIIEPAVVDAVGDAAAELRRTARGTGELLTRVPGLAAYEAEKVQAAAAQAALEQAITEARDDHDAQVVNGLDEILTEHLAPVHDQIVTEARQLWPLIADIVTPPKPSAPTTTPAPPSCASTRWPSNWACWRTPHPACRRDPTRAPRPRTALLRRG